MHARRACWHRASGYILAIGAAMALSVGGCGQDDPSQRRQAGAQPVGEPAPPPSPEPAEDSRRSPNEDAETKGRKGDADRGDDVKGKEGRGNSRRAARTRSRARRTRTRRRRTPKADVDINISDDLFRRNGLSSKVEAYNRCISRNRVTLGDRKAIEKCLRLLEDRR